ncbi:hypothetical protein C8Q78DRAFT_384340 [Trametes maxima]|nr:hypothetical protein C8Q78DRAFT_384340 [Trametes maxima]
MQDKALECALCPVAQTHARLWRFPRAETAGRISVYAVGGESCSRSAVSAIEGAVRGAHGSPEMIERSGHMPHPISRCATSSTQLSRTGLYARASRLFSRSRQCIICEALVVHPAADMLRLK